MRTCVFASWMVLLSALILPVPAVRAAAARDWPVYLGDKSASHYSTLSEITPANVSQLQVAWTWHAGDAREDKTQIQCNPLIIEGVLYGTTPQNRLVALDAATGRELWRFEPVDANGVNHLVVRGGRAPHFVWHGPMAARY